MNLPSDVTLPELKLHLEFKDPNDPFKNSVKTSKYFSNVSNYVDIDKNLIDKKAATCKDSTFIFNPNLNYADEYLFKCFGAKASEPFYVEYYAQVVDRENNELSVPNIVYYISFDNMDPFIISDKKYYFNNFKFENHIWTNSCTLKLSPWCVGDSESDYGPLFKSINDDVDENLYFDVNHKDVESLPYPGNGYQSSIPIYFKKSSVESYRDAFTNYYPITLVLEDLKEYLKLKDKYEFLKYGFLANLDSNNFFHMRYYINDILVFHLKSRQTHLPSNVSNSVFYLRSTTHDTELSKSLIKDFKLYCHIDDDDTTKKNIKDGIAGTNWFNSSIKVIEDPSLKSKEEVEDEINKQLALNPYIDLNELQIFAKINDNNLYPVQFAIQDGKVHIKYTDFIAKKQLYIGSKRQFIHHQYIL